MACVDLPQLAEVEEAARKESKKCSSKSEPMGTEVLTGVSDKGPGPSLPVEVTDPGLNYLEPIVQAELELFLALEWTLYRLSRMEKLLTSQPIPDDGAAKWFKVPEVIREIYGPGITAEKKTEVKNWVKQRRFPKVLQMLNEEKRVAERYLQLYLENPTTFVTNKKNALDTVTECQKETKKALANQLASIKSHQVKSLEQ